MGVVVGAAALGGAAYAVIWTLDSLYGWIEPKRKDRRITTESERV